jgi:hypothetical protein
MSTIGADWGTINALKRDTEAHGSRYFYQSEANGG